MLGMYNVQLVPGRRAPVIGGAQRRRKITKQRSGTDSQIHEHENGHSHTPLIPFCSSSAHTLHSSPSAPPLLSPLPHTVPSNRSAVRMLMAMLGMYNVQLVPAEVLQSLVGHVHDGLSEDEEEEEEEEEDGEEFEFSDEGGGYMSG